ncbi:MAG: hypothetical protein H7256_09610 [Bdellovibrio sp.]|nr:hypothetical protein [Bdellovibrio sp.]
MRLKYFLAIVVTFLIMGVLFYKDRPENPLQTAEDATENISDKEANTSNPKIDQVIEKQASDTKIKDKSMQASDEQALEIKKNFASHIKELGACLEVPSVTVSDKTEPTFESLSSSLKTALGEVVVKMDDWTQTDFKAEDGTMKRIRTEVEYQDSGNPIKRAQFYKINAQGMPELQNLNPDQATDPSEDFLASLRGDGHVALEEQGGRVYYEAGEELVMVERGGKLQSFSLTKGEKTFSCTDTDATSSNCQCLN